MNYENQKENDKTKGLEMYFSEEITEKFAELEQNEKNFRVAKLVDNILVQETASLEFPIYSAELGGGAHPDRYHEFFDRLLKDGGYIDWVDISPYMLKLAEKYISDEKYQDRKDVITFIQNDILEYLYGLEKEKLDLAIMKYTIDHIEDLDRLFELLSEKLKTGAKLVSTIGNSSPELKSHSTNARFLYNGEEFPDDEVKILKDGDNFTAKFFKVSADPSAGYLRGAETLKYYHSPEKMKELAEKHNFDIFLGDWKDFVMPENQGKESMDQDVLVLTKR